MSEGIQWNDPRNMLLYCYTSLTSYFHNCKVLLSTVELSIIKKIKFRGKVKVSPLEAKKIKVMWMQGSTYTQPQH